MSSITPRGMSIQEAYRIYSEGGFLVNRKYQRKLVWTNEEKQYLIDSILQGLPIPLILLASMSKDQYEIIDGLQRLNAIFSFIENRFSHNDRYFDVNQFSRAKQLGDSGLFSYSKENLLKAQDCANILDYQLAVTIYPNSEEHEIANIFGRINSGGKQLSDQEKRQAGMLDKFSNFIRIVSSEIRGDSSKEILVLQEMPEISIDSNREKLGYGIIAENVFWVKHGILNKNQLRDSEDEEMILDITASILSNKPIARSKDEFDSIYNVNKENDNPNKEYNEKLVIYNPGKLRDEIKATFSFFKNILEQPNNNLSFKSIVIPGSQNPSKNAFYSFFMALFDLVINQRLFPENNDGIISSITGLNSKLKASAHYAKPNERKNNINLTKGLILPYFVKKDTPVLTHGPGLLIDVENSIRRSKIESNRYECKQGIYDLDDHRKSNKILLDKLVNTACGIANVGPEADGYIFIGIADTEADVNRIVHLDNIKPYEVTPYRTIVGIDRELKIENINIETYCKRIISHFQNSQLSQPLKDQILSQFDTVCINGCTIIRIRIPHQNTISFVGSKSYTREGPNTLEIDGPKIASISQLFFSPTQIRE